MTPNMKRSFIARLAVTMIDVMEHKRVTEKDEVKINRCCVKKL